MQQKAIVKELLPNGGAVIAVERRSACSGDCDSCHGCAHQTEIVMVTAHNDACAKPGDTVQVESATGRVLRLALLLYIMPMILMIGGYLLPFAQGNWKVLTAFLGLGVGIGICVLYSSYMKRKNDMTFHITYVLEKKNEA
jgi:sigma-E factor negative regulatory protein RseC